MTPLTLFEKLMKAKDREEFIKILRQNRLSEEYVCDKCDKRRRYNLRPQY